MPGGSLDALVIGGGPAGLTAAIYLARYRRNFLVVDAANARCAWIPRSHNHPGFPDGINGVELIQRMRCQAERYGAIVQRGRIVRLDRTADGFVAEEADGDVWRAPLVLLATGVIDIDPGLPDQYDSVRKGLVRYCPICDGYEVTGERVAVIGSGEHAVCEAEFIRPYAGTLTVLTLGERLTAGQRDRLAAAGIGLEEGRPLRVSAEAGRVEAFHYPGGRCLDFDSVYSAMGIAPRNDLARGLGADLAEDGRVRADPHQETSIPGLFAAGDIAPGLNQITIAQAQGAIAATAMHNRLRRR